MSMDTKFKKEDKRLIGNKFAKGNKPNQTSFKKGEHPSLKTEFKKGLIPWNRGKKTVFPKCKICGNSVGDSRTKICRKCFVKENHCQWLGGKSFEPYGLEFNNDLKDVIRNRDRRKCFICGKTELENKAKLIVHHIDYNKQNNNPKNLVSLCRKCHLKTNYGRTNWIDYFKNKVI